MIFCILDSVLYWIDFFFVDRDELLFCFVVFWFGWLFVILVILIGGVFVDVEVFLEWVSLITICLFGSICFLVIIIW